MPATTTSDKLAEERALFRSKLAHEVALLGELHGLAVEAERLLESAYRATVTAQEIAPRLASLVDACEPDDGLVYVDALQWQALKELRDTFHELRRDDCEIRLHRVWRAAYDASGHLEDAMASVLNELSPEPAAERQRGGGDG